MLYAYEASFEYMDDDSGRYWLVSFPQFDGAFTDGETIEEAARNAGEVLALSVADCLDSGEALPAPTFHDPPLSVVCVEVDERAIEMSRCLTIAQAAEELGVSRARVSQLLSSGALEAREVDGRRMVTIASVSARKASPPAPHRPRREVAVGMA